MLLPFQVPYPVQRKRHTRMQRAITVLMPNSWKQGKHFPCSMKMHVIIIYFTMPIYEHIPQFDKCNFHPWQPKLKECYYHVNIPKPERLQSVSERFLNDGQTNPWTGLSIQHRGLNHPSQSTLLLSASERGTSFWKTNEKISQIKMYWVLLSMFMRKCCQMRCANRIPARSNITLNYGKTNHCIEKSSFMLCQRIKLETNVKHVINARN